MTNLSKISRSIIVVVFIAFIVFLGYQDIMISVNGIKGSLPKNFISIPNLFKVIYVIVLTILVIMYVYIKEKLYKLKVKRKNSLIFRYIYLIFIGTVISTITLFQIKSNISIYDAIVCVTLSLLTGVFIKKMIFNVSKSDILSVIGYFAFISLIDIVIDKNVLYISKIICMILIVSLYVMQIIIDELKQKGIKNNKYIVYSVILGILMGVSILLGVNGLIYVILGFFMFFIGSNLDNAHITFPRKAIEDISKEKREFLFKIERINISKLLVCVLVSLIITSLIFVSYALVLKYTKLVDTDIKIVQVAITNFNINRNFDVSFDLSNLISYMRNLLITSRAYYTVLIIYILFMEVLAFVLNRRYDTKSTMIKLLFLLMFSFMVILNLDMFMYQLTFTAMLIIIAIVNTSNIYLNREERIKLLVA